MLPGGSARDGDDTDDPQGQGTGGTKPSAISRNWTGGYTSVDYFMLLPGLVVAYFGGQLVRQCAVEAGGAAAIALWAMIGFWLVVGTARWPTFRVLRWSWALAGVLGAVWTPG
ncbi:MAG: hypothetical protein HOV68_32225 [Streptomycetaceae bacterium]|nr:hypothetical protein [Streptomycetaceae bacterium]